MRKKAVFLRCEPLKRPGRPITHARKNNAVKRKKMGMGKPQRSCVCEWLFLCSNITYPFFVIFLAYSPVHRLFIDCSILGGFPLFVLCSSEVRPKFVLSFSPRFPLGSAQKKGRPGAHPTGRKRACFTIAKTPLFPLVSSAVQTPVL